jgi:hypothetical protein
MFVLNCAATAPHTTNNPRARPWPLRPCKRRVQRGGEREREMREWVSCAVLHFCIAGEPRQRMCAAYESPVGDEFYCYRGVWRLHFVV